MKARTVWSLLVVGIWAVGVLAPALNANPAQGAQAKRDDYEALDAFLPDRDARDEDAKILVMINCTSCHAPDDTKSRIASRVGGDLAFWTSLVRRMSTGKSAYIPDEDIRQISSYLARHFGPASKPRAIPPAKKP